jgi:TetR/AcrR family transcriptional repressor of nem operon
LIVTPRPQRSSAKTKILDVALTVIRAKGYAATTVDDLCAASNVTKGAFFHHFHSKADLGMAILDRYARADIATLDRLWDQAERLARDPLQQLMLFVGLYAEEAEALAGDDPGCLYATFVYERQLGFEAPRAIIEASIRVWRERIRRHLDAVVEQYPPRIDVELDAVADLIFAANEGAYIIARATGQPNALRDQLLQVRNYLELLFGAEPRGHPARAT